MGVSSGVYFTALTVAEIQSSSADGILYSGNLKYRLDLTAGGQLTITVAATGHETWNGPANGVPVFANAESIALTPSCLELRNGDVVLWSSSTTAPTGSRLLITTSGKLNIINGYGSVIWPAGSLLFEDGFETF